MNTLLSYVPHAARLLLGLIFFVFGLNGFLGFIPHPPMPEAAGNFMAALMATGYFFPVLKATEVAVGLALLSNRFVPLALVVLAPISVQIFLFHAVLDPGGLVMAIVIVGLHAYLGWAYRENFRGVLAMKAEPHRPGHEARAPEPATA